MREHRGERDQRRDNERPGRERGYWGLRARGLVQRAGRELVDTGIPWNTPAPTFAIPWRRTPGSRRSGSGAERRMPWRHRRSARTRSAATPPPRCRCVAECCLDDREVGQHGARAALAARARRAPPRAHRGRTRPTRSARRPRARAHREAGARNRSARISTSDSTPTSTVSNGRRPAIRSRSPARARRCHPRRMCR